MVLKSSRFSAILHRNCRDIEREVFAIVNLQPEKKN